MTTRLWLLSYSVSAQGSSKNDGSKLEGLIPAEYTLVSKYLLNHHTVFKLQTWQFGDFTNEENLFSKVLNSYLLRFCLEYS